MLTYVNTLISADVPDNAAAAAEAEEGDKYPYLFARFIHTRLVGLATDLGDAFYAVETVYRRAYSLTESQKSPGVRFLFGGYSLGLC